MSNFTSPSINEVKQKVLTVFQTSQKPITIASIQRDLNYEYPKYLIARAFWRLCDDGICEINRTKLKLRND